MRQQHTTPGGARRRARWLAAVVGLVVGLAAVQPAAADTITSQRIVATDATNSLRPQIAADSANNLHVVWYDGANNGRRVEYIKGTLTPQGYVWSGLITLYNPGGAPSSIHPRLVVDRQDVVHVVWSWRLGGGDRVLYQRWPVSGGPGASSGVQDLGAGLLPAITVDGGNRLHVVWERELSATNFEVIYRTGDTGGNFGGEENISNNGRESLSPEIAIDTSGVPNVVWYDKTPGAQTVLYSRRLANGWQPAQTLSAPDSVFPSIAADGQGCLHTAWNEVTNDRVAYRRICGGAPEATKVVGTGGSPRRPAVGSNAAGNVVVAWDARAGATNVFIATGTNGGGWSALQRLEASGNNQLWSDVAGLPNGQLAVVWQEETGGQFDPAVALVNPAPAPAPQPQPTPQPTPAPQPSGPATGSFGIANPDFQALWNRTDSLVAGGAVGRSWLWGPAPFTQGIGEYYAQSPGQARAVQYFDKSRMEINQPGAPRNQYYVSNGRLADELITGQLQVGDAQYEARTPAAIPVAGDRGNSFPLYSDLRAVYRKAGGDRANQILSRGADGSVQVGTLENANNDPSMVIAQRVNGLGIPRVLWDYMNRPGLVAQNGRAVTANPLYDWRYVIGEPLTEAYWVYVKVGGQDRGVLVQAFERRVLTFTPTNPDEYKVEMGNIGRHYFEWRYGVRP